MVNMNLEDVKKIIECLHKDNPDRLSYEQIRTYISQLAQEGVYQSYSMPSDLLIHRVRQLKRNKWFTSQDDLGPPPPDKTTVYGRCHQPKNPLCYYSLYEDIALAEIRALAGRQYVISTFLMPKGTVVIPVGELDCVRRTGQTYIGHETPRATKPYLDALNEENGIVAALIDAFLADQFMKPRSSAHYMITSALSDVLLNGDLGPRTPIDALVYPSVVFRGGMNFAASPAVHKTKMKLVEAETRIVQINHVLGYGIFDCRTLAKLKAIDSSERLVWKAC